MNALLSSAHAWFFNSCHQSLDRTLVVSLVEGIKGTERQFVEVGEQRLGPYFPLQVLPDSRCVDVIFKEALVWFAYDESFDTADPTLKRGEGRFLYEVEASSFREFSASRTNVASLHQGSLHEYLLTCEDRILQVLAAAPPVVVPSDTPPDISTERTNTWAAS